MLHHEDLRRSLRVFYFRLCLFPSQEVCFAVILFEFIWIVLTMSKQICHHFTRYLEHQVLSRYYKKGKCWRERKWDLWKTCTLDNAPWVLCLIWEVEYSYFHYVDEETGAQGDWMPWLGACSSPMAELRFKPLTFVFIASVLSIRPHVVPDLKGFDERWQTKLYKSYKTVREMPEGWTWSLPKG